MTDPMRLPRLMGRKPEDRRTGARPLRTDRRVMTGNFGTCQDGR